MNRFTVISSDCHAGLPPEQYRDYLDPKYRETFDQVLPLQKSMTDKSEQIFLLKEINDQWRAGREAHLSGAWDYEQRLCVLDGDCIAGEIVFPDGVTEQNAPPFGAGLSLTTKNIVPDLQWAGAHAHNRWLAELCARDPVRHFGVGVCPLLWDVERAVQEARFAGENGIGGLLIPAITSGFDGYHNPKYNPFWEACQDLDLVICFHSGPGPYDDFFGEGFPETDQSLYPGAVGVYISEVFFWTYRGLMFMLWGGVFERFPKLRASVTETGQGWLLPPMLRMLDHHYHDTYFSAKLGRLPQPSIHVASGLLPPQLRRRRQLHAQARCGNTPSDGHEADHVGQRLPTPGRYLAQHGSANGGDLQGPAGRRRGRHAGRQRHGVLQDGSSQPGQGGRAGGARTAAICCLRIRQPAPQLAGARGWRPYASQRPARTAARWRCLHFADTPPSCQVHRANHGRSQARDAAPPCRGDWRPAKSRGNGQLRLLDAWAHFLGQPQRPFGD